MGRLICLILWLAGMVACMSPAMTKRDRWWTCHGGGSCRLAVSVAVDPPSEVSISAAAPQHHFSHCGKDADFKER
jgi:hypothetical protein